MQTLPAALALPAKRVKMIVKEEVASRKRMLLVQAVSQLRCAPAPAPAPGGAGRGGAYVGSRGRGTPLCVFVRCARRRDPWRDCTPPTAHSRQGAAGAHPHRPARHLALLRAPINATACARTAQHALGPPSTHQPFKQQLCNHHPPPRLPGRLLARARRQRRVNEAVISCQNLLSCVALIPEDGPMPWKEKAELADVYATFCNKVGQGAAQAVLRRGWWCGRGGGGDGGCVCNHLQQGGGAGEGGGGAAVQGRGGALLGRRWRYVPRPCGHMARARDGDGFRGGSFWLPRGPCSPERAQMGTLAGRQWALLSHLRLPLTNHHTPPPLLATPCRRRLPPSARRCAASWA